jgi:hypothetical protein
MLITEDEEQHFVAPSPTSTIALVALSQADTVLLWDPEGRTLIAANLVGRMPWTEESQEAGHAPAVSRRRAR